VVGFNALSAAEKVLFDHLQTAHRARFYWDFDDYYLKDDKQEAGLFVRENLARYPAPADFVLPSHFLSPKEINVISTASDSLQTKYSAEFIDDLLSKGITPDKRTAIVLTNESLLSPLLYSLPSGPNPEEPIQYNVTMGFPLRSTLAYSFVERLLLLQQRVRVARSGVVSFYHSDVEGLLVHPFVVAADGDRALELRAKIIKQGRIYVATSEFEGCSPLVAQIFEPHNQWQTIQDYIGRIVAAVSQIEIVGETADKRGLRRECFGLIMEALTKSANSLSECASTVDMKFATYVALIRRVLQGVSIPYKGEPLSGVQVMGILETRNLDFDNVLLLSMNDDNFPSARLADISFIPYNLRFAYGMPTPRHNEGVYAYYFYRLVSRARRVDMVYCSVATDRATGEQSRYIYQLDYESPHTLKRIDKGLNVSLAENLYHTVAKRGDVLARLNEFRAVGTEERPRRTLSPSALNNYILCPLKFYFSSVAGIRTEEEIEEGVDNALFGTIFHKAMENLYTKPLEEKVPLRSYLQTLTPEVVHKAVVDAISSEFYEEEVPEEEYGGKIVVVRDTVERYITSCVVPFDQQPERGEYRLCGLEERIEGEFDFGEGRVCFGGIADRLDLLADGTLRIIDYKTGSLHNEFGSLEDIFAPEGKELYGPIVQTLLYAMLAERLQREGKMEGSRALPALYFVRYMGGKSPYSPLLNHKKVGPVESYGDYAEEYEERLAELLRGLFDPARPFEATKEASRCAFCDFAKICLKG
jgi:CRISPR/Cas system-associated exonuclease Cas4 (RecB family)